MEDNLFSHLPLPDSIKGFTHRQIIEICYKWVLKRGSCGFAFKDLKCLEPEIADVIGFGSGDHSILIECKVSRSDFMADKKKSFRKYPERGLGRYRFYAAPKDLIKVSELPDNWGLIEVNDKGKARMKYNPYCKSLTGNIYHGGFDKRNKEGERSLMYSALRRLHLRNRIDEIYNNNF